MTSVVKKLAHRVSGTISRAHRRSSSSSKEASPRPSAVSNPSTGSSSSTPISSTPLESPTIPGIQHACLIRKAGGKVVYDQQWPVTQPSDLKAGECLVRLTHSGVCECDFHPKQGDLPFTVFPLIGGHEGIGEVVALGSGTADSPVQIGDRVGIKWVVSTCGACEWCRRGHEQNCPKAKMSGANVPGTFQQYVRSWVQHVTPIPKNVDSASAAPIMCAGITVFSALKSANCIAGEWVAVSGAGGGLGHLAIQYARAMGYHVIAIDSGEAKRRLCVDELGAEGWVDFATTKNVAEAVNKLTPGGLGVHAAIVTATAIEAYQPAIDYIRPQGRLLVLGMPNTTLPVSIFMSIFKSITVIPSYVGNRQDCVEALALVSQGKIKVHYKLRPLRDLEYVYDHWATHTGALVVAIPVSR